ncbi:MAG TPA: MFS transporter [Candidatus Bathyarchaeia archaeon]|nr:MFS transporter [Candidatus Bathyarchaeia archaeon]
MDEKKLPEIDEFEPVEDSDSTEDNELISEEEKELESSEEMESESELSEEADAEEQEIEDIEEQEEIVEEEYDESELIDDEYSDLFDESEPDITTLDSTELESGEIIYFEPRMNPNIPGKHKIGRTILISFAFLSALVALTYYNLAVPVILDSLVEDDFIFLGFIRHDAFIGLLMTIDNILAVTLQPLFGYMSDRTSSKLGRRMPYMIIGVIGCALFFGIAPWGQILGYFVGMLICYNIMMAFFRSPALSLVPDYTEEKHRSTASGLQQLIANIGTIVAFGIPIIVGLFVSRTTHPNQDERNVIISKIGFPIVSAFMLISLLILFLTIKETPTGKSFFKLSDRKITLDPVSLQVKEVEEQRTRIDRETRRENRKYFFSKRNVSLILLFFAVFFWFSGFAAIEAFFTLLGSNYFGLDMDRTPLYGLVYPISMIVASVPTGLIGKKFGRKKTLYLCLGFLIVSLSLLSFVVILLKSIIGLVVMMAIVGFFWMGIIVNTFPMIWRLCPETKISTFTGIYYTFNQSAAILGPIVIGFIFDFLANKNWGNNKYKALFPFVLGCILVALLFLIFVKGGEANDVPKKKEESTFNY